MQATCAVRDLPADMHSKDTPGQDLRDDRIFDFLDVIVDVSLSDCVCDLPSAGPPAQTPLLLVAATSSGRARSRKMFAP